jgi:hypothetical protein
MQAESTLPQPPPAEEPGPHPEPTPGSGRRGRPSLFGQRRRFLIHRASQLRAALIITGVALILVVLLNLSLQSSRIQSTAAIAAVSPELGSILQAQNRFELGLGIAASLVFLVGIFAVTILETHKTAGAAYHLCRELERIRDGLYGIRVKLRRGDNLREVEAAFNEMSRTLAERAVLEVEELEHAASVADRVENLLEASDLAKTLREMADERRQLSAGLRSR